jgi:hypothetical protein
MVVGQVPKVYFHFESDPLFSEHLVVVLRVKACAVQDCGSLVGVFSYVFAPSTSGE